MVKVWREAVADITRIGGAGQDRSRYLAKSETRGSPGVLQRCGMLRVLEIPMEDLVFCVTHSAGGDQWLERLESVCRAKPGTCSFMQHESGRRGQPCSGPVRQT
jgi:hypothetical protein